MPVRVLPRGPGSSSASTTCPAEIELRTVRLSGPAVRDRRAAVAAERLRAELHSRRGLAALVLRAVDHRERSVDDVAVEAVLGEFLAGAVELDVRLEHLVELG